MRSYAIEQHQEDLTFSLMIQRALAMTLLQMTMATV